MQLKFRWHQQSRFSDCHSRFVWLQDADASLSISDELGDDGHSIEIVEDGQDDGAGVGELMSKPTARQVEKPNLHFGVAGLTAADSEEDEQEYSQSFEEMEAEISISDADEGSLSITEEQAGSVSSGGSGKRVRFQGTAEEAKPKETEKLNLHFGVAGLTAADDPDSSGGYPSTASQQQSAHSLLRSTGQARPAQLQGLEALEVMDTPERSRPSRLQGLEALEVMDSPDQPRPSRHQGVDALEVMDRPENPRQLHVESLAGDSADDVENELEKKSARAGTHIYARDGDDDRAAGAQARETRGLRQLRSQQS